ncbi:hypothetical protein [Hominifimenecus sp. rT4P-3]|uniref:hypothetical protein n=1 Tax=Hominifimenecus sp. rT4P-3 TaxID=3242979 RepID=UPI003DA60D26
MKKNFKWYAICWAILFAVFQAVCFAMPKEIAGISKFDGAFWPGYIFISLAFIGQLICAYFAFKADSLKKMFYKLPLITVSYSGLLFMVVFGALGMAIPALPNWVSIIICLLILAFHAISVLKASVAADMVEQVDKRVDAQTQWIKRLTVEAEGLVSAAKSEAVRAECKKVYEAIRYSDPMSNDALSVIEEKITVKVDELAAAAGADDAERAKNAADEVRILVEERNKKCKALK